MLLQFQIKKSCGQIDVPREVNFTNETYVFIFSNGICVEPGRLIQTYPWNW